MKTLLLLRHGKPQENSPEGDKGRQLTSEGERQAAFIGERIAARFGTPDHVLASDAARARRTAEVAAASAGYQPPITLTPAIYDAEVEDLLGAIQGLPDEAQRVLLVGHNPGLWELTAALSQEGNAPSLTPATLVVLDLDVAPWADVGPQCGRVRDIIRPEHH